MLGTGTPYPPETPGGYAMAIRTDLDVGVLTRYERDAFLVGVDVVLHPIEVLALSILEFESVCAAVGEPRNLTCPEPSLGASAAVALVWQVFVG